MASLTSLLRNVRTCRSRALALLLALAMVGATSLPVSCELPSDPQHTAQALEQAAAAPDMAGMHGNACGDPCCQKTHAPAPTKQGSECAVHCAAAALPVPATEGASTGAAVLAIVPVGAQGLLLPKRVASAPFYGIGVPDPPQRRSMPLRL